MKIKIKKREVQDNFFFKRGEKKMLTSDSFQYSITVIHLRPQFFTNTHNYYVISITTKLLNLQTNFNPNSN